MKKTVLVTGSSRGIGRAIALKYAEHGYNVVINCARSTDRLEQVKKEAEALGAACLAVQADVGSWEDCVRLFARIQERFGDLDILVNNAGIIRRAPALTHGWEDWQQTITLDLSVPFLLWNNVDMRKAIGTSAAIGFPIAAAGCLGYLINGWSDPRLLPYSLGYLYLPALLGIVAVSMFTAPLGARLAQTLPVPKLKKCFAVLLIVVGVRMLVNAL